ncbi:hypothetical protein CgunFtcFv8_023826 [Champsocephalus gunnari]|uniref:Uncharacterized protein n=1 Tax=Champsocephalus gunnari TaxID=52237 RepID=A0AAN8DBY7_CHAGU|nr:hypothetical protein CgunFtcFv8_023826 [Champsocephalus gunnari]
MCTTLHPNGRFRKFLYPGDSGSDEDAALPSHSHLGTCCPGDVPLQRGGDGAAEQTGTLAVQSNAAAASDCPHTLSLTDRSLWLAG